MFGKWHLGQQGRVPPRPSAASTRRSSRPGKHFDFDTDPHGRVPEGPVPRRLPHRPRRRLHHAATRTSRSSCTSRTSACTRRTQAKPELIEKFKDKPAVGGHHDPTYAAMIYSVDESVGRIMATLDELKLADNTLVIFSSDNGGVGGYVRDGHQAGKDDVTDNAPLRGGKGMLYEGGVRVPFIFRWPGKIAAGHDVRRADHQRRPLPDLRSNSPAPSRPTASTLDGVSHRPAAHQRRQQPLDRDAIYWHFPGYLGAGAGRLAHQARRRHPQRRLQAARVLRGRPTRAVQPQGRPRPEEQPRREGARRRPRRLHAKLVAWRESVGAKMPTPNDKPQPSGQRKRKQQQRESDDE